VTDAFATLDRDHVKPRLEAAARKRSLVSRLLGFLFSPGSR
jgi:hypothetical protein